MRARGALQRSLKGNLLGQRGSCAFSRDFRVAIKRCYAGQWRVPSDGEAEPRWAGGQPLRVLFCDLDDLCSRDRRDAIQFRYVAGMVAVGGTGCVAPIVVGSKWLKNDHADGATALSVGDAIDGSRNAWNWTRFSGSPWLVIALAIFWTGLLFAGMPYELFWWGAVAALIAIWISALRSGRSASDSQACKVDFGWVVVLVVAVAAMCVTLVASRPDPDDAFYMSIPCIDAICRRFETNNRVKSRIRSGFGALRHYLCRGASRGGMAGGDRC